MSAPPVNSSRPPASDVSWAVGVVGLGTLVAWIAVCRLWPELAPALGLPRANGRLSGPNAALTDVVGRHESLNVQRCESRSNQDPKWRRIPRRALRNLKCRC